jgi:hypothetical protein
MARYDSPQFTDEFGQLDVYGHSLSEWYIIVIGKQSDDIQQVR